MLETASARTSNCGAFVLRAFFRSHLNLSLVAAAHFSDIEE